MDLTTVLKLLPTIIGAIGQVRNIIDLARSNDDLIAKIASLSPAIANFLKTTGATLFPQVAPELQSAAATISIYGQEFVKQAQMLLNIASPLLGLPNPQLAVDGLSGPKTQAATKAVQEKLKSTNWKDLVVDGFFGFKTKDAIAAFLSSVTAVAPKPVVP